MRLTKSELRLQQVRLNQLEKYLPTLQLKKTLLQLEVNLAQQEIEQLLIEYQNQESLVKAFSPLFSSSGSFDLFPAVKILEVRQHTENIAGLDIPVFDQVIFQESNHFLFDAPVWIDAAMQGLRKLIVLREKIRISEEKKAAIEKELREVSIRVNLFEKILIPRALANIRKIRIFLGDQQLAAVCQAKVAKQKIIEREELEHVEVGA
jgi:V/A-type H+-transporting ATPase subunit D